VSCFGVREEIVKEIEVFEILGDYCSSVVATVFWLAFFTACRAVLSADVPRCHRAVADSQTRRLEGSC
jgi:hypothetical protein